MTTRNKGKSFLLFILLILGFLGSNADAQVVIPRDGFPYCEPFTNSTTRANTVFDGDPTSAFLTSGTVDPSGNGVLRLTNNDADQRGYVFVDLPFSSAYGIKTSFEYFAYAPWDMIQGPGDGLSFFLFDGNINAATFEIGGLGGSLGYSPLRYSGGNFGGGYGLRGAYMGIGLDEVGNWGNQYEGKYGGFANPFQYGSGLSPAFFPRYPNSIAIRGPVRAADTVRDNGMTGNYTGFPATFPDPPTYDSYQFIDGKILNNDPSDGSPFDVLNPQFFLPSNQRFTVGAQGRVVNCAQVGYRKVFIDLRPIGNGNYTISMDMLVRTASGLQQVQIFNNVPYPYTAPQNLKVGFAAATGAAKRSIHEIRNVTVEVSSIDPILAPNPPNLDETVCFDQDLTFDFNVSLPAQNQFIRCLQLYQTNPGPPNNNPNPNGDPFVNGNPNCGLSGVCEEKCKPENKTITVPGVGTFESILEDLTDGNFNQERNEAKIKFTPVLGFFGTHTIFYNVIDNYGLTSEPRTLTVTVNPFPKIDSTGAIIGPTCDGQSDGSISNIVISDLIPGYTFSWRDQGGNLIPSSNYTVTETIVGGYTQATIGVNNVNLGVYSLQVNNPATNSACDDTFVFDITNERGTPVEVVLDDQEVCEGTPVIFEPELEDPTDANNPTFLWWKNSNKTPGSQITNGLTEGGVTYSLAAGVLTITGLPQSGTPYEYFVEVAEDPSQNLCATPAGQLKRVQVLVLPPLSISLNITNDLCRQASGSVTVNATGGFPTKTYSLDGINFSASNIFNGLLPGNYTVYVNAGSNCIGQQDFTIQGPASVLSIALISQTNPSCGLENGIVTFSVAGGTPGYTFTLDGGPITANLSGSIYTITGLSEAPTHSIEVIDANNCSAVVTTPAFNAIPIPTFDASDAIICPGETAILTAQIINQSNATNLQFTWTDGSGNPLVNGNGITYTSNTTTGELQITGLAESATPYQFNLLVTGNNLCNSDPLPATVTVNPTPKINPATVDPVSCFGESTGTITLNPVDPAQATNYEYSIDGGTSFQASPVFNNLGANSYDFIIRNSFTGCFSNLNGVVVSQPAELILTLDQFIQAACGVPNGQIEVSFGGGSPGYTLELLLNGTVVQTNNTPSSPTVYTALAPGDYQIRITDSQSCVKTVNQTLINDVGIPITVDPMSDELCFGDLAIITPIVTTSGNPVLKWYKDAAGTDEIVSSPTPDANGHIFTINPSTQELTVSGLDPGDYTYYLVSTGPGYCPNPPFEANIQVLEPINSTLTITNEICFGSADGSITINATGSDGNYEYSLDGGPFVSSNVFLNLAPKTYTIDVRSTGGNNCTYQTTAVVAGPSSPIAINSPDILRSSCDLANGSIENLTITGGWGNYSVEWRRGSLTGPVIQGDVNGADNLLPDTYYILITDDLGCEVNFNFTLEEMPDPVYVVAPVEVCAGETVVLTPVNTVAGSAASDLKWYKDASKTTEIVSGPDPVNPAINYSIDDDGELIITGLEGNVSPYAFYLEVVCTNALVEVEALVKIIPNLTIETSPEICFGAGDGKIRITSGGISTFEYSVDGAGVISQADLEAMSFAPKVYSIDVSNAGQCLQTYQVEVLGPPSAISINSPGVVRSSCGLSNGSIENLTITGGWGNYTVEWRKGSISGPIVAGDSSGAQNLSPDTYFILISDGEGCEVSFSFLLEEQPRPEFQIAPVEVCEGETVLLTPINIISGSSSSELKWYKDSNRTQEITPGVDPTNPSISYGINSNGQLSITGLPGAVNPYTYYLYVVCTDEIESVTALVRIVPKPVFESAPVQCFGANDGEIRVTTGGLSSYSYSINGASPITETQLESLQFAPGTYSIEVDNGGFCTTTFSVEVLGPNAPLGVSPLTQIDPGCGADIGIIRAQITGGWSPYTVNLFRNGSSINSQVVPGPNYEIGNLAPGTYFLTITDSEGCTITSNTITMVYGPSQILVDDLEICEGEQAVFVPTINPAAAGVVFGWFKDSALTIPITSSPTPDSNGHIFEISSNGTLTVTGLSFTNSPATYYATASGPNVCPGFVASPQVIINRLPALSATVQNEVCFGDQGQITLTGSAGNGVFAYSLNGTDWSSSNVFNVSPGVYTGYVRSGVDCITELQGITVVGPSSAISTTTPVSIDPVCNQPNGSIGFEIAGGYGNYTVIIERNGQVFATDALASGTFEIQNLPAGNYTFTIQDQNPDGVSCDFEVAGAIQLINQPTPLEAQDDTICEGETATLVPSTTQTGITPLFTWYQNANGTGQINSGTTSGITYQISPAGELSITGLPGRAQPYTYYVKISGTGVCEPPLVPVDVVVYDIPNLRVSNPSIVCDPNGTVDLTEFIEGFNSQIYDYQILNPSGGVMRLDEIGSVNQNGSYQVASSLKGSNCWSPNQRIQVIISDTELIPEFNYEIDLGGGSVLENAEVQIQEPVQFLDVSSGKIIIWNWDFGDGTSSSDQNPTHEYQSKGIYTVTLTTIDEFGCVDTFERVLQVFDDYVILVPNAFTPQGVKNQFFKPQYRGIASMEFFVFNTWGELIFESNTLETSGWDGTLNGKNAPNGNYVYKAIFMTRSGIKVEKSGVFLLIR